MRGSMRGWNEFLFHDLGWVTLEWIGVVSRRHDTGRRKRLPADSITWCRRPEEDAFIRTLISALGERNLVCLCDRNEVLDITGIPIRVETFHDSIKHTIAEAEILNATINPLLPWQCRFALDSRLNAALTRLVLVALACADAPNPALFTTVAAHKCTPPKVRRDPTLLLPAVNKIHSRRYSGGAWGNYPGLRCAREMQMESRSEECSSSEQFD
jgi:hypothetical protein